MRNPRGGPASREEFQRELTDLIAFGLSSRRRLPIRVEVNSDTPLFESGLIDSLAILELIAFVEHATGRSIPARQVHLEHFGSINRICESFWREAPRVFADRSEDANA
jgi:acyl carrier protein